MPLFCAVRAKEAEKDSRKSFKTMVILLLFLVKHARFEVKYEDFKAIYELYEPICEQAEFNSVRVKSKCVEVSN